MLKEEAMALKEKLQNSEYDSFHASDGWLDGWKANYAIRERRIVVEAGDVAEETITSCMERIVELTEGYKLQDIWNMMRPVAVLKHCQRKDWLKRAKKPKEEKSPNND